MTEKKNRRCNNCTKYNVNCREPNRFISMYATECRKYSESPQKPLKCKACGSKGVIVIRGSKKDLETCPICNGTGFINTKPIRYDEFIGADVEFMIDDSQI